MERLQDAWRQLKLPAILEHELRRSWSALSASFQYLQIAMQLIVGTLNRVSFESALVLRCNYKLNGFHGILLLASKLTCRQGYVALSKVMCPETHVCI